MAPIAEAELAVVAEIFRRLPGSFVWIGGSVLQLLHRSPRVSNDVDLVPLVWLLPGPDVPQVVSNAISSVNVALGIRLEIDGVEPNDTFFRIRVKGEDQISFSIDLTRITGSIRATRSVIVSSATGTAAVIVPTDSCLLAAKVRAFLLRRFPKPGDMFDIWFLLSERVSLEPEDRIALEDEFADLDAESVDERFRSFRGKAWIQALSRSGVTGLTPETGADMAATVRRFVLELVE